LIGGLGGRHGRAITDPPARDTLAGFLNRARRVPAERNRSGPPNASMTAARVVRALAMV
jgi:hypothetical protein